MEKYSQPKDVIDIVGSFGIYHGTLNCHENLL